MQIDINSAADLHKQPCTVNHTPRPMLPTSPKQHDENLKHQKVNSIASNQIESHSNIAMRPQMNLMYGHSNPANNYAQAPQAPTDVYGHYRQPDIYQSKT